jgi:hypothetical protein
MTYKSNKTFGKHGALALAFRELAKAIWWWYQGPGTYMHFMTGPHEYSDQKPFCNAGPQCHRCQKALIARAAYIHRERRQENFGDASYIGMWAMATRFKLPSEDKIEEQINVSRRSKYRRVS